MLIVYALRTLRSCLKSPASFDPDATRSVTTGFALRVASRLNSELNRTLVREREIMKTFLANRLIRVGVFLGLFGVYLLFIKEAAVNSQQQTFRFAVPALGLVLCVVGFILKASSGRGGDV